MPQRQPTPVFVPFLSTRTTLSSNVSDLDEIIRTTPSGGEIPTDPNIPQIISNLNAFAYNVQATLVNLNETCQWTPMSSGHVAKMWINIAVIGDMTAFTDETVTWDTVSISLTEVGTGNVLWQSRETTGITIFNLAGEVRMFIIAQAVDNQAFQVSQGVPININIQTTFTQTTGGTDPTFQFGLVPFFPLTADSNSKFFSQSGIVFYLDRFRSTKEIDRQLEGEGLRS